MKKFIAALLLTFILGGHTVLAFTNVANFVAASSQTLYAADSASLSVSGDFTLETWVNFASTPCAGTGNVGLASKKNFATSNQRSYGWFLVGTVGACRFQMDISSDGTSANQDSVIAVWTPSTGVWYHIAAVHSGSTGGVNFYVDEVLFAGTSLGTPQGTVFDGNGPFMLGAGEQDTGGPTFSLFLDGKEFLARLWNTQRTVPQLTANKCVALGVTSGMQGEWTLDNVLTDGSGNSNTLTNFNTVTFPADVACTPATTAVYLMFQPW